MEAYNLNLALLSLGIIIAIAGAFYGSFCSKIVYRLEGERMKTVSVFSPSICPNCIKKLEIKDKIPVVSYVLLGGKCRRCGAPITKRYLVLEIIGMILPFVLVFLKNFDITVIADYFFVMTVLCDMFISFDKYRLPVMLSYFILFLALIINLNQEMLVWTLLTFIISYPLCHIYYTYMNKNVRSTTTLFFASCSCYLGMYSGLIVFIIFILVSLSERFINYLNNKTEKYYTFSLTLIILADFFLKDYILDKVSALTTFIFN